LGDPVIVDRAKEAFGTNSGHFGPALSLLLVLTARGVPLPSAR
jgi:hypothetical protein